MFLTGLPRVLDDAGVSWSAVAGWQTRTLWKAGITEVRAVFWHTTETQDAAFTPARGPAPTLSWVKGDTKEKPYPSYNLLIGRDGHVHLVAAGAAAHAGKGQIGGTPVIPKDLGNRYAFGISFDANNSRHPITAAQIEAGARLGAAIDREWRGTIRHIMHGEYAPGRRSDPTMIPGGWSAFRAAIKRGYWKQDPTPDPDPAPKPDPTTPAPPAEATPGEAWPKVALKVTDKHTAASHNAWLELMADVGYKSTDLGKNLQSWLAGLTDPRTGKGYYPMPPYLHDGIMGPAGVKALQRKLYDSRLANGRRAYNGKADGIRGPLTVRAEIAYLNDQRRYY